MRIPLIGDTQCHCLSPEPMPYGHFDPRCWVCVKCGRNVTGRVAVGEVQPLTIPGDSEQGDDRQSLSPQAADALEAFLSLDPEQRAATLDLLARQEAIRV